MKYIMLKIFENQNKYGLRLMVGKYKDNYKNIEKDLFKYFDSKILLKQYLNNLPISFDSNKTKIFINYIGNQIIIDNIIPEIDKNLKKDVLIDKINDLYPDNNLKCDRFVNEIILNNKKKQYVVSIIPKNTNEKLLEFARCINSQKIEVGLDVILFQSYLLKKKISFNKKLFLLIQKDDIYWRFYQVLNGVIINYLLLNEEDDCFKIIIDDISSHIDKSYDEIIVDADYRTFVLFTEKYPTLNISYVDYVSNLKNIDERKIEYGKKVI